MSSSSQSTDTKLAPRIAIISAGAMGSAVAARLVKSGCKVITNLDGRSEGTKERAKLAGMKDVPFEEMATPGRVEFVLSILPPSEAKGFAIKFIGALISKSGTESSGTLVFADCNAVNPKTVQEISELFNSDPVKELGKRGFRVEFVDAGIIGGPPSDAYNPTFYAAALSDTTLDAFEALSNYGLVVKKVQGGIGSASALKMSYAGITKGLTGIFTTMILAAHASSPTTSDALLHELRASQPVLLHRLTKSVPPMLPKAYRWVGEMEEIAEFVGQGAGAGVSGSDGRGEGQVYTGVANLYRRVEKAVVDHDRGTSGPGGDVQVLLEFVEKAKKALADEHRT